MHVGCLKNLGMLVPHPLRRGMANALETSYSPHYHTKFCCYRSNHSGMRRGFPKNLGMLGPHPLAQGHGRPPINMFMPHVLPYQILWLQIKPFWHMQDGPKDCVGHWGTSPFVTGVWLTLKHATPPFMLPCQIWSLQVEPYEHNYGDLPENFDPSCPAFQGHSRSMELTWINRLPVTSYQCFIVTIALACIVSKINGNICKIFTPSCI